MTLPTHLAAGLIIGKITGDYLVAFLGASFVDLDHFFAFYRSRVLSKVRKIILAVTNQNHLVEDQRSYFHNLIFFLMISIIFMTFNFKIGLVFSLAYLSHLILDSLDNGVYYPLYPYKKINLRGPIKYFSKQEIILAVILFFVFLIV